MPSLFIADENVLTATFLANAQTTATQSTFTWSSLSAGAADDNRYLIACLTWQGSGINFSSATIGGVTATQIGSTVVDAGARHVAVVYALVPTGTTATVVLNLSGNAANASVALYRVDGIGTLSAVNTTSTANDPTANLTVADGGCVIACANAGAGSSPSATWTNATEDCDNNFGASNLQCRSSASKNYAVGASETVTCDFSVSTAACGAFVVFTP